MSSNEETPNELVNQEIRKVLGRLKETDESFWDDIESTLAASALMKSPDRFSSEVDWLARALQPTSDFSDAADVSDDDRSFARWFVVALIVPKTEIFREMKTPPLVVNRMNRLSKIYGGVIGRIYDERYRSRDWEYVEVGSSKPVGVAVDPTATLRVVVQRYDGQLLTLQTRPNGYVRLVSALIRELSENIEDGTLSRLDSNFVDELVRRAQALSDRVASLNKRRMDTDTV